MSFVCLMYHSLSDGRFPDQKHLKYTTTRALFGEHLNTLLDDGFQIGRLADLTDGHSNDAPLPAKYCLLTFDDGHKSSLDLAEVMAEAKVSGTFFLTKDYCQNRDDFLKDPDIRDLLRAGFDFGTHGVTHRALSHMPPGEMRAELFDSKRWLEDITGQPVRSMSLPAGKGNASVYRAAHEVGYEIVGNSQEMLNRTRAIPLEINRFCILANHRREAVRRIARGSSLYIWQRKIRSALIYLPKRLLRSYNTVRG